MAWTNFNPTSTAVFALFSPASTVTWMQLEPWLGLGISPFGAPSDNEFLIHSRGFGDPLTKWTAV